MISTEEKLARELGVHPTGTGYVGNLTPREVIEILWRKCLELTEQRERGGGSAKEYEYPPEIKQLFRRCEAGEVSFSNDEVSALLCEIDRVARSRDAASSRLAEVTAQLEQVCGDVKAIQGDYANERRENATLRAEVERLTTSPQILGEDEHDHICIVCDRKIGLCDGKNCWGRYFVCIRCQSKAADFKKELARLKGERDAAHRLGYKEGLEQGIFDGKMDRLRAETAEAALSQAQQALRWISVSEKLPEPGDDVLIWVTDDCEGHHNFVNICAFGMEDEDAWRNGQITHWMPLPSPPEAALPSDAPQKEKKS